jgi:3-phenylpropionate/trans-cinnamate dioxygenase ferredoxin reductase subunit
MPGQFAWLTIGKSPFAIEEHPFSFSSSAVHPETLSFTIKELGDFTSTIKDVSVGERVYLDGPYGSFSIDRHNARGYVFIAGGIGIAPVMCTLRTLADRSDSRPLTLVYATRTLENATFLEEISASKTRLNLDVIHVLEDPLDSRGYHYFICGPDPMMDMVETALYKLGVPISKFHSERFNIV